VRREHSRDPELVQADVGDQQVLAPERLSDLPQGAWRLGREVVVVASALEAMGTAKELRRLTVPTVEP